MNFLKNATFFFGRQHCKLAKGLSKERPLLQGRETEGTAKNISGKKTKAYNGGSLAVVL